MTNGVAVGTAACVGACASSCIRSCQRTVQCAGGGGAHVMFSPCVAVVLRWRSVDARPQGRRCFGVGYLLVRAHRRAGSGSPAHGRWRFDGKRGGMGIESNSTPRPRGSAVIPRAHARPSDCTFTWGAPPSGSCRIHAVHYSFFIFFFHPSHGTARNNASSTRARIDSRADYQF